MMGLNYLRSLVIQRLESELPGSRSCLRVLPNPFPQINYTGNP